MTRRPRRSITLLDAIVLVAATAVGFAWVRSNWSFEPSDGLGVWLGEVPGMLGPLLATWTVAVVLLRLIPPRPPLHRIVLQPGAAACGSVAFALTIRFLRYLGFSFAESHGIPWYLLRRGGGLGPESISNVIGGAPFHVVVMVAWGLLWLGRRCRPEPSWIDRLGRAIGLAWIALALWSWSVDAIDEWREQPTFILPQAPPKAVAEP